MIAIRVFTTKGAKVFHKVHKGASLVLFVVNVGLIPYGKTKHVVFVLPKLFPYREITLAVRRRTINEN